ALGRQLEAVEAPLKARPIPDGESDKDYLWPTRPARPRKPGNWEGAFDERTIQPPRRSLTYARPHPWARHLLDHNRGLYPTTQNIGDVCSTRATLRCLGTTVVSVGVLLVKHREDGLPHLLTSRVHVAVGMTDNLGLRPEREATQNLLAGPL